MNSIALYAHTSLTRQFIGHKLHHHISKRHKRCPKSTQLYKEKTKNLGKTSFGTVFKVRTIGLLKIAIKGRLIS